MNRREALRLLGTTGLAAACGGPRRALAAGCRAAERLGAGSGHHAFRVGALRCLALADGRFTYPVRSLFADVAPAELAAALGAGGAPPTQLVTPYTCLLVDTGTHRVLVDTGAGDLARHAAAVMPGVDHAATATGLLAANLRAAGVAPADVDTVIVTHAHPDHVGGTLDADGALTFPNARYFVAAAEWDFWFSDAAAGRAAASMVDAARRNLAALRGRVTLVDEDAAIVPGIAAIAAPGHTPGHLALEIASGAERLYHVADAVLTPHHLAHPAWRPVFDLDAAGAARSKGALFDRAAGEGALVFGHHLPPFPGLGRVTRERDGWGWHPTV
jgi:glyoxylase-like metal-dependent hydrolase (beta-lactamase superfamily II)